MILNWEGSLVQHNAGASHFPGRELNDTLPTLRCLHPQVETHSTTLAHDSRLPGAVKRSVIELEVSNTLLIIHLHSWDSFRDELNSARQLITVQACGRTVPCSSGRCRTVIYGHEMLSEIMAGPQSVAIHMRDRFAVERSSDVVYVYRVSVDIIESPLLYGGCSSRLPYDRFYTAIS